MGNDTPAILPNGVWHDGKCRHDARLRPLNGTDEMFLLEVGNAFLPAQFATTLLSRCVTQLGHSDHVTPELIRALTLGDRDALTLQLRALTFGEQIECVLNCPRAECSEKMELKLPVDDFLFPPYPSTQASFTTTLGENGSSVQIRFHLPTSGDIERAAIQACTDPQPAADWLLHRCVDSVIRLDDGSEVEEWSPAFSEQVENAIAACDPQAELSLNLICPACQHDFTTLFDPASFLQQELTSRGHDLFHQIHVFAFYYHWAPAEILSMTPVQRRRYLSLILDELENRSDKRAS